MSLCRSLLSLVLSLSLLCQHLCTVVTLEDIPELKMEAVQSGQFGHSEWSDSLDEFIMMVSGEDEQTFYIITIRHIIPHKIKNYGTEIVKMQPFPHGIQNAYHELIHGYATHGYLALFKKYTMYYFKFLDDLIQMEQKTAFPASYFNIGRFTNMSSTNAYLNSIVMKSGPSEFVIIDFSTVIHPKYTVVKTLAKKGDIRHIETVAKSKAVAIAFDKNLDIYSQKVNEEKGTVEILKSFHYEYPVLTLLYIPSEDYLIVFHSNVKGDGSPPSKFCTVRFIQTSVREYTKGGKVNYDLGFTQMSYELYASAVLFNSNSFKMTRMGEFTIGFNVGQFIWILDLKDLKDKLLKNRFKAQLFNIGGVIGDKTHYRFNSTYQLSNLILTSYRDTSLSTRKVYFKHVKLTGNALCHPSCGNSCETPLVVCSKTNSITFSLIIGFGSILLLGLISNFFCVRVEKLINEREAAKLEKVAAFYPTYPTPASTKARSRLPSESMNTLKSPVIKVKYNKTNPTLIEAVDNDGIENDDELDKPFQLLKQKMAQQSIEEKGIKAPLLKD